MPTLYARVFYLKGPFRVLAIYVHLPHDQNSSLLHSAQALIAAVQGLAGQGARQVVVLLGAVDGVCTRFTFRVIAVSNHPPFS